MKQGLKVFFAGKIDPLSPHAPPYWRDEITWQLNQRLQSVRVTDSSLLGHRNRFLVEHDLPIATLFSQTSFYIKHSDAVVINLTNDISVGGSQELFIAKLYGIPTIGIAPRGGKFNRLKYELGGKTYWNWVHPFVGGLCDVVVHDSTELAAVLDDFTAVPRGGLATITEAVNYYQQHASALDTTINRILSFSGEAAGYKQKLRIYFAGKMGKASGFSETAWRDHFAAVISQKSRFKAVNLDFLEVGHHMIDESNPRLIFGRDAYLIRSSDIVVVNLSDDISIGGSVEMMLAKLFHRPLIGIAKNGGKFMRADKDLLGRHVSGYVNPYVSATCDWLISDPGELPRVVDQLFTAPVKSAAIIPSAASWYQKHYLRADKGAQVAFAL